MATIRMTGMVSGMDTEALVEAMVSNYVAKKEKYQKKQQLTEWKMEAYSDINSKIYSLYTSISNLRFSTAYNLKKASISDSTKATVSASTTAVNGTYSLEIETLATAGYLTGGKLDSGTTSSTTLGDMGYTGEDTTITVATADGTTDITIGQDTSISDLISSLKSAGLSASFDETNLRIYVSSADTGVENDFSLVANDENGLIALSKFGLCTESSATTATYEQLLEDYAVRNDDGTVNEAATTETVATILANLQSSYATVAADTVELASVNTSINYTDAVNTISSYFSDEQLQAIINSGNYSGDEESIMEQIYNDIDLLLQLSQESQDSNHYYVENDDGSYTIRYITEITSKNAADTETLVSEKISSLMEKLLLGSGNQISTEETAEVVDEEVDTTEAVEAAEASEDETTDTEEEETATNPAASESASTILSNLTSAYKTMLKNAVDGESTNYADLTSSTIYLSSEVEEGSTTSAYEDMVATKSSLTSEISKAKSYISDFSYYDLGDYTDLTSSDLEAEAAAITEKLKFISEIVNGTIDMADYINDTAVRIDASDSKIYLNGAEYTSSSNSYSINGLTIACTAVTNGDAVQITVATDTQGLYDQIKDFLTQYNEIINELCSLYNADSASGYEPLTDDEKAEMTDSEIEKWEAKIQSAILRHDSTISSIIDTMVNSMNTAYTVNGTTYSLASFGISTLGYLNAATNENYAYHIDGDSEDSSTSGNTDKLLAMITTDPDAVESFFKQLVSGLYSALGSKMSTSSVSSAFTIYNDKQLSKEYSQYADLVEEWEDKVSTYEDRYYSQFSAMETALSKLQAQSSALSSLLGTS